MQNDIDEQNEQDRGHDGRDGGQVCHPRIVHPVWHNNPLYYYGCYLVSLCMFLRSQGFTYSVPELNELLKKNGGFDGAEINPKGVLSVFGFQWKYERKDYEKVPADIGVMKELIDSGYPVITKVDFNPNTKNVEGHFLLTIGYVVEKGRIVDLIGNDPWTGKEVLLCSVYPYLKLHKPENAVLGLRIYRRK